MPTGQDRGKELQPGEIRAMAEELESAILRLVEAVTILDNRLEVVLDGGPASQGADAPPTLITATAMGKMLYQFRVSIDVQIDRLRGIVNRLAL